MKILFLGGTGFVGRHMVDAALKRGHEVTLFNRGKTATDLFPSAERIVGDRDGGLAALDGHRWDVAIDVNCYLPRLATDATKHLKGKVGRYVYVSTGSVYDLGAITGKAGEEAPLLAADEPESQEYWGKEYGPLKRLCEDIVAEAYPESHTVLRLGVVAGPHDPTDRVTYWVERIARGGEVLIPGSPEGVMRFIDARDLADFAMTALEKGLNGIYNTTGKVLSWKQWTDACQEAGGHRATLVWANDADFFMQNLPAEPRPFGPLPMAPIFFPPGFALLSDDKALAAGLHYRAPVETARDVLAWHRTRLIAGELEDRSIQTVRRVFDWGGGAPNETHWMAGLTPAQEAVLLAKWKSR
jgi:2'-hydroxyisoflavone reductase